MSWARLSEKTEARLSNGAAIEGKRFRPAEWNAGDSPWIIDVIAPFGGADKVIAEVKKGVLKGEKVKVLQPAPGGSGMAVVEW